MAGRCVYDFDQDVKNTAYCDRTGLLRVWDVETSKIFHEYLPSSHLAASCTCVKWRPKRRSSASQKRRNISIGDGSDAPDVNDDDSIVAMGTATGSILIYNVTKGELHCKLEGGHTSSITELSWNDAGSSIISCSSDSEVVHWDLITTKHTTKWKCGMKDVAAVAVYQTHLIIASRAIYVYDLNTTNREDGKITPIKKIVGHSSNIVSLHCLASPDENEYFIVSLATGDRSVSVWKVSFDDPRPDNMLKRPILALILSNEPIMSSAFIKMNTLKLTLSVVTCYGDMETFDVTIPSSYTKLKKPASSQSGLELATPKNELIPILLVQHLSSNRFVVIYGTDAMPAMETMNFSTMNSTRVIRKDPSLQTTDFPGRLSKTVTPHINQEQVTQLSVNCEMLSGKKRARFDEEETEMILSKRIALADKEWNERAAIQSDSLETRPSLVPILCQGLQSSDHQLLDTCLKNSDQEVMSYTMKHFPPKYIVPFAKLMVTRLQDNTSRSDENGDQDTVTLVKWCRVFFHEHASLLAFHPLLKTLRYIYHSLERRCGQMTYFLKLQGRLSLILSQIDRNNAPADDARRPRPLVRLIDNSSDEEEEEIEPSGATNGMNGDADLESEDGYSSGMEDMYEESFTATEAATV